MPLGGHFNNSSTHWAAKPRYQILCLHGDPSAFTYDSISPCSLNMWLFPLSRGLSVGVRLGVPTGGLSKDGWEWSKYCSSFPPGQYRGFGRVTRQTGPGIKNQSLFHGGLAPSLSLDCTCCDHGGPALESDLPIMWPILFYVRYDFGDLLRED